MFDPDHNFSLWIQEVDVRETTYLGSSILENGFMKKSFGIYKKKFRDKNLEQYPRIPMK